MATDHPKRMQCSDFDALLSDALDNALTGERFESFHAHARDCSICGPLFAEALEGQRWLKQMVDVEPPVNLVENILVATTGLDTARMHGAALNRPQPGF